MNKGKSQEDSKKEIQATTEIRSGVLTAIASTEDMDRSGDVLSVKNWDFSHFVENPVLQAGHDYKPQFTIGIAKNLRVSGSEVLFEPVFHNITPLAQQIKKMYEQGFLKAWSVGFIPDVGSKQDGTGGKNELLEISAVAVPANAMALMKGFSESDSQIETELKDWMTQELEEKSIEDSIEMIDVKTVVPYKAFTTAPESEAWNASKAQKESWGDGTHPNKYAEIHAWYDNTSKDKDKNGYPTEKGAYKLPHHTADDKVVWRGVAAAMGALLGSRGGVNIPDAERKGVYNHLSKHYKQFNKFVPNFKEYDSAELKSLEDDGHIINEESSITEKSATLEKVIESNIKKVIESDIVNIKEAWNNSLPQVFNKSFEIGSVPTQVASFENDILSKFFDCEIKNLFVNSFQIPSPLLGSYLSTIKSVFSDYELVDTRNWEGGVEYPPLYEVVTLNSEKSDDFLVEGIQFYKVSGENGVSIKFSPNWFGMGITMVSNSSKKDWNKEMSVKIHKMAQENNLLRGEKFALNGKFLTKGGQSWNDVILNKGITDSIQKSIKVLKDKNKSRGLLFVGPPGTGKTMTGKVLMNDVDSTFIWISSKDMERVGPITAIRLGFELARKLAPTILFMEDIDSWIKNYTVDLLKTELDGIEENKGLVTILTSNHPDQLPDALIDRPGRFHEILNYSLPNEQMRSKMIQEWSGIDSKAADILSKKIDGFSGAHIKELISFAKDISEDENIELSIALELSLNKLNEQRDLIESIRQTTKSVEEKSGRIISTKNKGKLIVARNALDEIITLSETNANAEKLPKKMMSDFKVEVPTYVEKKLTEQEILLKTLQSMVKLGNSGLQTRRRISNKVR